MTVDRALATQARRRLASGERQALAALTGAALDAGVRGDRALLEVTRALEDELVGFGPLAPLLDDAAISDIVVTGPDAVWCDRGGGLERAAVGFADEAAVRRFAQRMAALAGRRLDDAAPFTDGRLADGTRLHAVVPPIAAGGTQLSLRIPRRRAFTMAELAAADTISPPQARRLTSLVREGVPFLVTGGTGTGKTTVLSTLLGLTLDERLVLVEDVGELLPDAPHVVRLQTRPPNAEGAGEITVRDLVRQALRMRPDRVVVGEARGAEIVELLTAFNTGHAGGCATLHANNPADVPARVEALAALAGLPREAAHSLLASAVRTIVHLARDSVGRRHVAEISALVQGRDGLVRAVPFPPEEPPPLVAGRGVAR